MENDIAYNDTLKRMYASGVVLLDGATGTELEKRGGKMDKNAWCGPANIGHRDLLEEIHLDYIRAGAEIITTNTYAASRLMLEPAGLGDRVEEVYKNACTAAWNARKRASRENSAKNVLIAGSISHMVPKTPNGGESTDPYSGFGRDRFSAAMHEAGSLLKEGGCDLIIMEMMYHPQRFQCVLEAALATRLPVWAGFSARWGKNKEILTFFKEYDIPLEELTTMLPSSGIDAAGIMHSHVNITSPALDFLRRNFKGPLFAYPDSGFLRMPNWQFENIISPSELKSNAVNWIADGVSAVGGCCGLSLKHIKALAPLKR